MTEGGDGKYTLSLTLKLFQNTFKNPGEKYLSSQVGISSLTAKPSQPSVSYLMPNSLSFQRTIQNSVKRGENQRLLQIGKMVKYCTYCYCNYYTEVNCFRKFLHLRTSLSKGISQTGNGKMITVGKRKHQNRNSCKNASAFLENSGQASFFAMSSRTRMFNSNI